VIVAALAVGCGPVAPSGPTAPTSGTAPPTEPSSSPAASTDGSASQATVDPGVGRLAWLVDRAGSFGVWTTDLAGGDVRSYAAGLDEAVTTLREPVPVDDDVVVIRDAATPELWVLSQNAPPRLLLDAVESFVVEDDRTVLAVRDEGSIRSIWRVPLGGGQPESLAELPLAGGGPELGPFGFALSPDGRTVAAGWVGGPVEISGPAPSSLRDVGAPLVVADDGRLVATTGRAGEAYLLQGGRLTDLAPTDSDPFAVPPSGTVAWGSVGEDGQLAAVEVRDLIAGTRETHPAGGSATRVVGVTESHVILEATAFDPLSRTVTIVDRRDGTTATFTAPAPNAD
jgi:hypothetical protein